MPTFHLHLQGLVQGVGFRPFVYRYALDRQLLGWVNNTTDGVHVIFNAPAAEAEAIAEGIVREAPALARITRRSLTPWPEEHFADFRIRDSASDRPPRLLLTPDFALCPDCRAELFSAHDRRRSYPFITCTNCGPRYSIIRELPYDRPRTTMADFPMCGPCQAEYDDPTNRRFYSQTNSCPNCPVHLQWWDSRTRQWIHAGDDALDRVVQAWQAGEIVAIKGIGGYLLTCAARNEKAVAAVRARKHRPHKPLAVMYPDLAAVQRELLVTPAEAALLSGPEAPIVLLRQPAATPAPLASGVAPDQLLVGVMLPYAPLMALLLRAFGEPIVATSGNASGFPIAYADEQAVRQLAPLADQLLGNDRPIVAPQDDSVVRVAPESSRRIVLRRARGWAPTCVLPGVTWPEATVLATGADMKAAFGLLHQGYSYLSQYLGALDTLETQAQYRGVLDHLLDVFRAKPGLVITDTHPAYFSRQAGEELARGWQAPTIAVQHHRAHFSAVLAEHGLWASEEPVLGFIWDGTGLGDDGQIWGSECFHWEAGRMAHLGHLHYFPQLLGDKMAREPRLSALALCGDWPEAEAWLRPYFSSLEWNNYQKLRAKHQGVQTASMGRLFDAVAALLGLRAKVTYEGEAALLLENLATKACGEAGQLVNLGYHRTGRDDPRAWLQCVIRDRARGVAPAVIAARFHYTLVQWAADLALRAGVRRLAFSGGVFQNALLVDLLDHYLGGKYELFFHEQLSPNDENIALGQLAWWHYGGQAD
ncbi:MAG: carbamoyltransferase HypF [Lewinella sp.]|nr:carbamoyltransferase HypF [Lewinella sp.]